MRTLLRLFLRMFPAAFRTQFAADMTEQIERDYAHARSRGFVSAVGFAFATALDLAGSALAERWHPSWAGNGVRSTKRKGVVEMMDDLIRDLRHALRTLSRSPGFTAVTIGTLGLAIGANAGIFSVVDAVLLNPLPYSNADRLVHIAASAPGSDFPEEFGVSAEFYVQYGERSELLEDVALYNAFTNTLRVDDRTERVWMSAPTVSLFRTLGVQPILGRLPTEEDENRVALISHALWTTWFGNDPDVIGRSYYMAGGSRTVIGVMGPDFWFPDDRVLLWVPFTLRPEGIVPGRFGAAMLARLKPGATHEALATELSGLARQLPERFGGSANYARLMEQHRPVVRSLEARMLGDLSRPLWILLGSVGLVLLIACANVANLFIVRTDRRQRDLAIRRAVGAGRGPLIRSQMAEVTVIALGAGMVAVLLAWLSVPLLLRAAPEDIPRLGDVAVTGRTLGFTLLASLCSAVLFGLIPAIRAAAPKMIRLRDGGRGSTRRRHWGRDGLVVAQTALALVLLIGSGLLVRSFWQLRQVDPGYDTEDILTFQIAPEEAHLRDAPSFAQFHFQFMKRLAGLPGVESVGLVENVPLNEGVSSTRFRTDVMGDGADGGSFIGFTWTAGDYFETMGIDVVRGRTFTTSDHISELGNVIISESAANLLWPGEDAIGRRLQRQDLQTWETVVGVVEDVMQSGFRDAPQSLVYFPLVGQNAGSWVISSPAYVLKTRRAETIAPEVRALAKEVSPSAPMYRVYTMAGLAADSMVQLSFTSLMLGIASMLALILGAVGLYGVLSYVVSERTQEIGVRMALGAQAARVRAMVVAQGARVVVLGVAIGAATAAGVTRALSGLLFGVQAVDAATFAAMSATVILVGLLASYMPARRASRVDPIQSLKGE